TSVAKTFGPNNCLYLATDINEKALLTTRKCGSVNGVNDCVQLVSTDLTEAINHRLHHCIDLLVFNPPYVPTPTQEVGAGDISSSWAGGVDGRQVIDRFLPTVPSLLTPNGLLYLIVVKENKISEICDAMKAMDFEMTIVLERKSGPEHLSVLRFNSDIIDDGIQEMYSLDKTGLFIGQCREVDVEVIV
ncbi:unnamed protein product, partial [Medioppia subpectinata]